MRSLKDVVSLISRFPSGAGGPPAGACHARRGIALTGSKCHVGAPPPARKPQQIQHSEPLYMRNFHLAGRSTVHAQNGMAATSHPLAALTAIEVLKSGGTAADAAVAACALLG